MWKEFKAFAVKGNVIDLAVGVVIGTAFGKIVTSLVNDVIMPPIGFLLGKMDFSNFYINLSTKHYANLEDASKAGAPIIKIGLFLNSIISFLIISFCVFLVVKQLERLKRPKKAAEEDKPAAPTVKTCGFCYTDIPVQATRCPHCTSHLETQEA